MINAIAHACLGSSDLAKTEQFYSEVLGLDVTFRFRKGDELIGMYFGVGRDTFLEVFKDTEGMIHERLPIRHFCLEVQDIKALEARLGECKVEHTEPKLGCDQSWQLWCEDPDGIRIEFHEYTENSAQRTGQDVEIDW